MRFILRFLRFLTISLFSLFVLGVLTTAGVYLYVAPDLPAIEVLKDVRLQVPLRVYSRDRKLMAEFGEMKRNPLRYKEINDLMIKAVLAAEDDRFFEHPGVDYQGILRAAYHLIRTGEKGQGGSTITMQVARNFFLSREKTYLRKINEIFLSLKIEQELSKEEVLELYLNVIYLGNRAYGVDSAAQVYYGKNINDLDISQIAMIAGLPKAPSRYNPIVNPERAAIRRNYVLRRMRELNFIDQDTYEAAKAAPVSARHHRLRPEITAPYVAEMVRAYMVEQYGDQAYTAGFRVFTTVEPRLQAAANQAVQKALLEYDQRHGFRGVEGHVDLAELVTAKQIEGLLQGYSVVNELQPALVLEVAEQSATVALASGEQLLLEWSALSWARKYIDENHRGAKLEAASDVLNRGDIVRLRHITDGRSGNKSEAEKTNGWLLSQIPQVEGALVSLNPADGAIKALVGGFNFYQSKFNRVTQAERQPGSNFKPFIYSAALEKGFTAASLINDAPVVFDDPGLEDTWRPENYSGKFFGPTRIRIALTKSRNLVSIRLLREMGIKHAINYAARFGFDSSRLPHNLSLALGSGSVAPMEIARGYATFANGGYRIEPYYIDRIEDAKGKVLLQSEPLVVCSECEQQQATENTAEQTAFAGESKGEDTTIIQAGNASNEVNVNDKDNTAEAGNPATEMKNMAPRIISKQNHYLMVSMMGDVIRYGTGRRALKLGRKDIAGKTGTTNDQRDAWFSGYNRDLVTVSWVGFDKNLPLGSRETGARAALPMWLAYMGEALKGTAESTFEQPPGMVSVRIDPDTGELAQAGQKNAVFEIFREQYAPTRKSGTGTAGEEATRNPGSGIPQQLF
ncbi:MAG: penicillin-binding protein 1A [Gammaproteobacteria bacterium]|nr:MAG: penicillin-binding protein 1A [Gammaproteobacteria bacterium]